MPAVLRILWVTNPYRCVLVDEEDRFGIRLLIKGKAFLKESARTISEAQHRADALQAVFCPTDQTLEIDESDNRLGYGDSLPSALERRITQPPPPERE